VYTGYDDTGREESKWGEQTLSNVSIKPGPRAWKSSAASTKPLLLTKVLTAYRACLTHPPQTYHLIPRPGSVGGEPHPVTGDR